MASMRARTATSTGAGSHRTSERFFLRHNSAKGVRPFKLTDDMKSIIFGGSSALPEWVAQENERGGRVDGLRGSTPQSQRTDARGGFKSLTTATRQQDMQVCPALRCWMKSLFETTLSWVGAHLRLASDSHRPGRSNAGG